MAKTQNYKGYPFELKDTDRLVIIGLKGNVRLIPQTPGKPAVLHARKSVADRASGDDLAKFENLSFTVRRDGGTVLIETKGPDSKNAWSQWLKPGTPELSFDIEAPQVPVEIMVREGLIAAQNWRQAIFATVVSGAIRASGNEGLLRAQIQRGELKIEKHRGRVEADSYGAKLLISGLDGDLELTNFSGESNLTAVRGNIEVLSQSGSVSVTESGGSMEFTAGRSNFVMNGFEGPIRGQADHGVVNVTVKGDAEVHIESNQAPVTVKLPADSGALVRLQTEEGALNAPEAITKGLQGRQKLISGRLAGTGPKGTVALKSKDGPLRVRQ